jgi:hypothetical protein
MGTAPLATELQVFEGSHRILVTVGQSKWSQVFTLYSQQRMKFDVELE